MFCYSSKYLLYNLSWLKYSLFVLLKLVLKAQIFNKLQAWLIIISLKVKRMEQNLNQTGSQTFKVTLTIVTLKAFKPSDFSLK